MVFQSLRFHSLNHTLPEIDLKEQYFDILFEIFFLLANPPFKKEKVGILFFISFYPALADPRPYEDKSS